MIDVRRSSPGERRWGKARRDRNRAAGRCVNDTLAQTHGPIVSGNRCAACDAVWLAGNHRVLASPALIAAGRYRFEQALRRALDKAAA